MLPSNKHTTKCCGSPMPGNRSRRGHWPGILATQAAWYVAGSKQRKESLPGPLSANKCRGNLQSTAAPTARSSSQEHVGYIGRGAPACAYVGTCRLATRMPGARHGSPSVAAGRRSRIKARVMPLPVNWHKLANCRVMHENTPERQTGGDSSQATTLRQHMHARRRSVKPKGNETDKGTEAARAPARAASRPSPTSETAQGPTNRMARRADHWHKSWEMGRAQNPILAKMAPMPHPL